MPVKRREFMAKAGAAANIAALAGKIGLEGVQVSLNIKNGSLALDQPELRRAYLETAERTGVAIASFAIGELNNEGTEMPLGIEKSVRYDADYLKTLFPGK
jgi:hypothetical protein